MLDTLPFEFDGELMFAGHSLTARLLNQTQSVCAMVGRETLIADRRASKLALRRAMLKVAIPYLPPIEVSKPRALRLVSRSKMDVVTVACDLPYKGHRNRLFWSPRDMLPAKRPVAREITESAITLSLRTDYEFSRSTPIVIGAEIEKVRSCIEAQADEYEKFTAGLDAYVAEMAALIHDLFRMHPASFYSSQAAHDELAAFMRQVANQMVERGKRIAPIRRHLAARGQSHTIRAAHNECA